MASKMLPTRILWFPVENGVREIPARLALARYLADYGWAACIGHKSAIDAMVAQSDPGIYIYKNTHSIATKRYMAAKARGNITIAVEEEVLNFAASGIADTHQFHHQCDPECMRAVDYYFASNRADSMIARLKSPQSRILEIGSMRAWYSCLFRQMFGKHDTIQVSGRLGTVTGPSLGELLSYNVNVLSLADAIETMKCDIAEEFEILRMLVDLINMLSMTEKVLFRKHPVESMLLYRRLFGDAVEFDAGGAPIQHNFSSAKLLVGYSCTTLIEAVLAGIPVANLGPEQSRFLSDRYISKISPQDVSDGIVSEVAYDKVLEELYSPVDLHLRWKDFLSQFESFSRVSRIVASKVSLRGYAAERYGNYGGALAAIDIGQLDSAVGVLNSKVVKVKALGGVIYVLPGDLNA